MPKRSSMFKRLRKQWRHHHQGRQQQKRKALDAIATPNHRLEALEPRMLLSSTLGDHEAQSAVGNSAAIFIENAGQWQDQSVGFAYLSNAANLLLTNAGPVVQLFGTDQDGQAVYANVAVQFDGAASLDPVGVQASDTTFNFLIGSEDQWRTGVTGYQSVAYPGLYDGIDLLTFSNATNIKYEFHVTPGTDYSQISMTYSGVNGLSLDADGRLIASTAVGDLIDDAPVIYQDIDGQRVPVSGEYVLHDSDTVGFKITGMYSADHALVIDPDLTWSTYLGSGNNADAGEGVAVDASGNVIVGGITNGSSFPIVGAGAFPDSPGPGVSHGFVTKYNANGVPVWSTYLGGTGDATVADIAVDSAGSVYATGSASGLEFPTTVGNPINAGGSDGFVAKFLADGTLEYSTLFGGSQNDTPRSIAVSSAGVVVIAGGTRSSDLPTSTGAFDRDYNEDNTVGGFGDAFVSSFAIDGTRNWSSYIGGVGSDIANGVALDISGNVYLTGDTLQPVGTTSFPTTNNALDRTPNGGYDAWVAKMTSGGAMLWSTLFGTSLRDSGQDIAADNAGNVYVTGYSASGLPTTSDAYQGTGNIFFSQFQPDGTQLLYSTLLPGSVTLPAEDSGEMVRVASIAVDQSRNVWIGGTTETGNGFPAALMTDAFDTTFEGASEGFVHSLIFTGISGTAGVARYTLDATSFLGGSGADRINDLAIGPAGDVSVTGSTNSADFPVTAGARDPILNDAGSTAFSDAFVTTFTGLDSDLIVTGHGDRIITNGDMTPSIFDGTFFGSLDIAGDFVIHEFTITNSGSFQLELTSAELVDLVEGTFGDYVVIPPPSSIIGPGDSTTFSILYDPTAVGNRSITVRIDTNDRDVPRFEFRIAGIGLPTDLPEIDIFGNEVPIVSGDLTPSTADNTDFGTVEIDGGSTQQFFDIYNTGAIALLLNGDPTVEIVGDHASDFSVTTQPSTIIDAAFKEPFFGFLGVLFDSSTLGITFDPTATGLRTAEVIIRSNDGNESEYRFAIQGNAIDTIAPTVDIVDVSPDPRNTPVDAISIVFSEAVTGFDLTDLALIRNGAGSNLLLGAGASLASDDGGVTWTLSGLTNVTTPGGTYSLGLVTDAIVDLTGNPLAAGATESWTNDQTGATIATLTDSPDPIVELTTLTLTASGVNDASGVGTVTFYRDANNNGQPEASEQLGVGTDLGGGVYAISTTVTWAPGQHTYLAQASDTFGNLGNIVATVGTVVPRPTTTIAFGGGISEVVYVEPDTDGGFTTVTIELNDITGNVVFLGEATSTTDSGTVVMTPGFGWLGLPRINVTSVTGSRPSISFDTEGGDEIGNFRGVTGAVHLSSLDAENMNLVGEGIVMTGNGMIDDIELRDILEGADIIMPGIDSSGVDLTFAAVEGDTLIDLGSGIRSLTLGNWGNAGGIEAPWLDKLTTKADEKSDFARELAGDPFLLGDFGADLRLGDASSANAEMLVLKNVRIDHKITGGVWDIQGQTQNIRVFEIEPEWVANFERHVKKFDVRNDASGEITFLSVDKFTVRADLHDANIHFTQPVDNDNPKAYALKRLQVKNAIENVQLTSDGNIDRIQTGGLIDSSVFAGVTPPDFNNDGFADLPRDLTGFYTNAKISRLDVKGLPTWWVEQYQRNPRTGRVDVPQLSGQPFDFINSNVAASLIGKVKLTLVLTGNNNDPFGMAAKSLDSYQFNSGPRRDDPVVANDFVVRITDLA